ncbi:MAG TPA: response regulator [Ktedonobacteraceae bacterium]|nr:response regulator [Ktedonobacteraceae bacterium]
MEKDQHQSLLGARPTPEQILVVDDNAHVLQMIQWVLQDEGFEVQTAAEGQEALTLVRRHRPALLILDMGLPLLDGSHVAAELHTLYGTAVPIVLITADGHAAQKGRQIGASAFLHKPFEIADLVQAVKRSLTSR